MKDTKVIRIQATLTVRINSSDRGFFGDNEDTVEQLYMGLSQDNAKFEVVDMPDDTPIDSDWSTQEA